MDLEEIAETSHRLAWLLAIMGAMAVLVAVLFVPGLVAAYTTVATVEDEMLDVPPLPDEIPMLAQNSFVYDVDGNLMTELHGPIERIMVELDEIPDVTIDAVLATEDAEFFEHQGVNHESIARAAIRNLQAGGVVEGASTITQQLVTLLFLDPEPTIDRKIQEAVWAVELEERLSKEEILERYMNAVYLGHGIYGVATAARFYFSKDVGDLTLEESATLAGMIRAPQANNPIDNPEASQTRRDIVLAQMAAQGRITDEEADEARASELALDVRDDPEVGEPFWVDWLKRIVYDPRVDLQPELQEVIGETTEDRIQAIFEGGLRIETTFDADMQNLAADALTAYVQDPLDDPLGSIISIEHTTGAVRAMALGPKEFGPCPEDEEPCPTTNVNPAVPGVGGSGRQSGSAFKPFVSAAALQNGFTLSTEYDTPDGEEVEGCGPPGDPYEPRNYDRADHGEIEMAEAMRRSINVYFVKLARDVGIEDVVASTQEHGIVRSPNLADFGERMCAIGLGAASMFPLEMVVGYGTWANDGERCDPYVVERVLDRHGEVLYEHEPECTRVVDRGVARSMQSLLEEPIGSGGTAGVVGSRVGGDAIGKTGTTDGHVDAWFIGTARGYTTAAWIGYEQPRPMENVTIGGTFYGVVAGGTIPAPMWADYVSALD
jgi:penicillin-binding protein 1A